MNDLQNESHNPLLSVWLHPKKAARYVIEQKSILYTIVLLSICYIGSLATGLIDSELYPYMPIWAILGLLIILSPIIGIISNLLYSLGIWLCGKLFGGIGSYKDIFQTMSLVTIPFGVLIPFYIIWMFVDPSSLFITDTRGGIYSLVVLFVTIVVMVWSFVISIAVVSEAHQFSNWRSFFTLLVISILLFIILLIVAVIIFFILMLVGMSFI